MTIRQLKKVIIKTDVNKKDCQQTKEIFQKKYTFNPKICEHGS